MQPNDFVYYIATPAKNLEDGCSFIGPYDTEQQRDNEVNSTLKELGWTVLRYWESSIKKDIKTCIDMIEERLA